MAGRKRLWQTVLASVMLSVVVDTGALAADDDRVSQEAVDAAMEKLRQRQAERSAQTQPTTAPTTRSGEDSMQAEHDAPESDAVRSKREQLHKAEVDLQAAEHAREVAQRAADAADAGLLRARKSSSQQATTNAKRKLEIARERLRTAHETREKARHDVEQRERELDSLQREERAAAEERLRADRKAQLEQAKPESATLTADELRSRLAASEVEMKDALQSWEAAKEELKRLDDLIKRSNDGTGPLVDPTLPDAQRKIGASLSSLQQAYQHAQQVYANYRNAVAVHDRADEEKAAEAAVHAHREQMRKKEEELARARAEGVRRQQEDYEAAWASLSEAQKQAVRDKQAAKRLAASRLPDMEKAFRQELESKFDELSRASLDEPNWEARKRDDDVQELVLGREFTPNGVATMAALLRGSLGNGVRSEPKRLKQEMIALADATAQTLLAMREPVRFVAQGREFIYRGN
jgi:hypothetical protein